MGKIVKNKTLSRPLDSCNLNMDAMVLHGPNYRQVHARTKMQTVLSLSVLSIYSFLDLGTYCSLVGCQMQRSNAGSTREPIGSLLGYNPVTLTSTVPATLFYIEHRTTVRDSKLGNDPVIGH